MERVVVDHEIKRHPLRSRWIEEKTGISYFTKDTEQITVDRSSFEASFRGSRCRCRGDRRLGDGRLSSWNNNGW